MNAGMALAWTSEQAGGQMRRAGKAGLGRSAIAIAPHASRLDRRE